MLETHLTVTKLVCNLKTNNQGKILFIDKLFANIMA